jgi:hypothetical protein
VLADARSRYHTTCTSVPDPATDGSAATLPSVRAKAAA